MTTNERTARKIILMNTSAELRHTWPLRLAAIERAIVEALDAKDRLCRDQAASAAMSAQ